MDDHEINKEAYPSNSILKPKTTIGSNEQAPNRKVVTGKVIKKKKSFFEKVTGEMMGDDARSVGSYILWDILIPAAKNTISEMVSTGVEMILFGETRGSSGNLRRDRGRSIVSYNSIYSKDRSRASGLQGRSHSRIGTHFDDIVIESRQEAEEVLSSLVDQIEEYDCATVADFYDLVGMQSEFVDNKYGWTNLNRASVNRVREGYIISLPKPRELE